MEKQELIERIKNILKVNGCFSIGELEGETPSICSGELGNYVGLLEYFTQDYAEENIYDPTSMSSDAIDSVEKNYEEFSADILQEILFICEQWEAECIRTEKRISN